MGDVEKPIGGKPFGISEDSPISETSSYSPNKMQPSQANRKDGQDPYISDEVKAAISRLHQMGRRAAKKGDSISRKFFWHYFRRELEQLSR